MASPRHKWDPICPPPTGLVRPVRVDPLGVAGPTRAQAQGPHWRRTTQGRYVPAYVDPTVVEQRILEKSMLLQEPGGVTGWAGCRLDGAGFFDGLHGDGRTERPVPLNIGPRGRVRRQPGVWLSRERFLPSEIVIVHGIQCANRWRSLFDEMRWAPDVREAVVAMDMMAAAKRISIRQMRDYIAVHPGWTGVPQARAALDLASEDSRSPQETRMRLIWVLDAGFPAPLVNVPVYDLRSRLLGIADLFDPEAGVVGEYDGADHREALRHAGDVAREERFRGESLEYFKVTGPDLPRRDRVVDRMGSCRSRAKWLPPGRRTWTIDPPSGNRPPTLDELLEERALMAKIYARYERDGDRDIRDIINL